MAGFSDKNAKVYPYSAKNNETGFQPKCRKPTDVCFMTVFATFLTVSCCLISYCVYHGDIGRVIYGYDNCGTVCGDTMRRVGDLENCYKTIDEGNFGSYHLVYYQPGQSVLYDRICTNNCSHFPGYREFLNRCVPSSKKTVIDKFFTKSGLKDLFVEVSEDFSVYWKLFAYLCLVSLVISLTVLLLFRYLARLMVWLVLIGVVAACLAATIFFWMSWKEIKEFQRLDSEIKNRQILCYLILAIASTCITIIITLVIFVMIKRIKLVIQLFDEAGGAVATMPSLLFEPILTFLALILTLSIWIYCCLWISSAGYLKEKRPNVYYYRKDGFMEATKVVNFFAMLWMVQFMIGCQHMIIAGAVSKWYFTRDKSKLSTPLIESFYNLTRYHLGTVATGSFLLALVQLLRALMAALQKMTKNKENSFIMYITKACMCICNCCLWIMEHILNMLSRNAYIITAMYGYSFFKAGKVAFTHLASNPLRVAAINSVGDFVLFLSKVLVVACTVTLGSYLLKYKEGIQHIWVPLMLLGLFSYFISHCFMTVYEMTIDTIFICFCEDCALNNGTSKPYYMSRGLMEFVDNSMHQGEPQEKAKELPSISMQVQKENEAKN